jgi:hypothetical protein
MNRKMTGSVKTAPELQPGAVQIETAQDKPEKSTEL